MSSSMDWLLSERIVDTLDKSLTFLYCCVLLLEATVHTIFGKAEHSKLIKDHI